MALFKQLDSIRMRLGAKSTLTAKERELLSELNQLNQIAGPSAISEASVRVTKMTGPDDGRCGCCGR